MQFKLAFSTAILGTITVAIASTLTGQVASYAKTNNGSELSSTQNRTCPTLTGENLTALELTDQVTAFANDSDTTKANRLLAITALCNGYGYGGTDFIPEAAPNDSLLGSTTAAETGPFLYNNGGATLAIPQAAAELDQLPQDRVEVRTSL